jgi:hypothetical protein
LSLPFEVPSFYGRLPGIRLGLEGTTVKVTNNNFKGLSQLCETFRFRDFVAQFSQFRASKDFKKGADAQIAIPMTEINHTGALTAYQGGRSFSEMSQVVLVHSLQTFKVSARLIVLKCDLFTDNPSPTASPYAVRSQVSLADFGEFVSALVGSAVKITNDNIKGLSPLCDEFRFVDLAAALSQFRDTADFKEAETVKNLEARQRLSALEERVQQRDNQIASLRRKLLRRSQAQEPATEAVSGVCLGSKQIVRLLEVSRQKWFV